MKQLIFLIFLIANSSSLQGQCTDNRFCLRFANPEVVMGGSHFEFDLVVSSDSDFGLGTSNVQFNYNNGALANPVIVSTIIESPKYQAPSITTPFIAMLGEKVGSFNLELNTQGNGINIPSGGITVSRIRFEVIDPIIQSDLSWYYSGGTTQTILFNHNESTQLCAVEPSELCLQPSSTVLPLELVEFKSSALQNSILLEWITESEQNSSHFEIERSLDGINFGYINNILAAQEVSGSKYSYDDKNVLPDVKYYYRLKIVDLDGRFEYSKIIIGRITNEETVFEVYPNPASENQNLFIKVNKYLSYKFTLLDLKGRIIRSSILEDTSEISLESLNSGMYFYRIEYEGNVKHGNLVIQ